MKPPASTPSAWALRYAVNARLATDSEVPKALVSATTEKLLMPLPERLISAKNPVRPRDRKSTRLNSSHTVISYAVFCLKKKTTRREKAQETQNKYSCATHRSIAGADVD